MPPSGCALTTRRSAAPASATASGSSARRTLSSAAIGMPMYLVRDADLGEFGRCVAHGCSTYSRSNGGERVDGVLGLVDVPAAVGVDADPALGAERLAHGPHARDVRGERLVGAATLTFAVRHPGNRASTAARCRGRRPGPSR